MIKDEIIYEFCKDHYYCDANNEDGERYPWEPFELYEKSTIETYIENDVCALKIFLKTHIYKEHNEENN